MKMKKEHYFIIFLVVLGVTLKYWETTKDPIEVLPCKLDSRYELSLKVMVFDVATEVINRKNVTVRVELEGQLINNRTWEIRDTKRSSVFLDKRGFIFGDKQEVIFDGLDGERGEEYLCEVKIISVQEAPPGIIFRP